MGVRYEAAQGEHDDFVVALALAWQAAEQTVVATARLPYKRFWLAPDAPLFHLARKDPAKREMQDAYAVQEGLTEDTRTLEERIMESRQRTAERAIERRKAAGYG